MLFLGNFDMALLDVSLEALHFLFLLLELVDQVVELLLQELVLGLCVQVIYSHSRYFIGDIFDLHLLLRYVLISMFSLLH